MPSGDQPLAQPKHTARFPFTARNFFLAAVAIFLSLPLLLFLAAWYFFLPSVFAWALIGLLFDYCVVCVLFIGWGITRRSLASLSCGLAMLFVAVLTLPIWALFIPALQGAYQASLRAECSNNLQKITLAVMQYHDDHHSFPSACIADASGKPMHSWRVLLLPYLDQKALYDQYRFDEPWDGPNNSKLHNISLPIYSCPAHSKNQQATETTYLACRGPRTIWGDVPNGYVRMADIIDGTSNTVVLVEVADSGIHWMEPRDLHINQMPLAINPPRGQGISSYHKGGANAAFADGSVRFLLNSTPPETLRALLTRNAKEPSKLP